jgi:hypothetical protein
LTFVLDYGQLDHWVPFDGIFETALEQVGPADVVSNLFEAHETQFTNSAKLTHGGWRRWYGYGLSESFVYALRDLLIDRYARARVLYKTWPIDPDNPYDFASGWVAEPAMAHRASRSERRNPTRRPRD